MKTLSLLALSAVAALASSAAADVRLPAILSSNMVVQSDADVAVWGWADPGEQVKVVAGWASKDATTTADAKGRWRVSFRTPAKTATSDPFKPYTVTVSGKANTITLDNVLLGEVWVCSGQSNMEMPVGDHGGGYRGAEHWKQHAAAATTTGIRLFCVDNTVAATPEDDCRAVSLGNRSRGWVECSPETVLDFSATGYFFGRDLRLILNVPIGLISADWGGTPAEAWTSEEGLSSFPEYAEGLKAVRAARDRKNEQADPAAAWWEKIDRIDRKAMGVDSGMPWALPGFDASTWSLARLPSTWGGDLGSFDGLAWFRRDIVIDDASAGADLTLSLGPIDDMDTVYLDGVRVGATSGDGTWSTPRHYTIPARLATKGLHTLAIRVLDTSGPGGINGAPEEMFLRAPGAEPIRLDGYWRYHKSAPVSEVPAASEVSPRQLSPNTPTALYNGMIAPLTNLAIRGAIWYQGESNRGNADRYDALMRAMITDWRSRWGRGDFPFYYVQIAPFKYGGDTGQTASLRDAQRRTLGLANTGMAVTMDIGNPADIHPANKEDVGKRLALWAFARTYGAEDLTCSGPLVKSAAREGDSIRIVFDYAEGLSARDLGFFEVGDAAGAFTTAAARIDGDSVLVTIPKGVEARQVRYAWCDDCSPGLMNGAGLPASPFRIEIGR